MRITPINPKALSFDELMEMKDDLYFFTLQKGYNSRQEVIMRQVTDTGALAFNSPNYAICKIERYADPKWEEPVEIEELISSDMAALLKATAPKRKAKEKEKELKPKIIKEKLTYKYTGCSKDGRIKVEPRTDGSIRVSFIEKADAEKYHEELREMFYKHRSCADYLTVASIYDFLEIVKPDDPEESKDWDAWVYPSLTSGPCTSLSVKVTATAGTRLYGFTIGRPMSMTKYEEWRCAHEHRNNAGIREECISRA